MTRTVLAITPDSTLDDAYEMMREANIHHLVVMKAGRVAGILSHRDLERARLARHTFDDAWTIEDLMASRIVVGSPEMTVRDAARLLRGHAVGCLPILDGKQLVGILTTSDLLDLLAQLQVPAEPTEQEIPQSARIGC